SRPILLAFLLASFNQLSGINFVIYYAPRIFEAAGIGADTALLSSVGIGMINLLFTLLGMYLIDRAGRKKLMLIGSIGYIISLTMVSIIFFREDFSGFDVPIYLFLFIASHAIGQGAVIWVYISEIFPNQVRSAGQSLGTSTHWIFAALITLMMPYVLNKISGGPIFAFFAVMMVLQLLFVILMMPETKGISLEDLQKKLIKEEEK
ncbi:MAG: MFS transporter, partial [Saprospiraceae bacterium]